MFVPHRIVIQLGKEAALRTLARTYHFKASDRAKGREAARLTRRAPVNVSSPWQYGRKLPKPQVQSEPTEESGNDEQQ